MSGYTGSAVFDCDKSSIFNYDNRAEAVKGTRLAQVFAVRINHIDNVGENVEVYGKITVQDDIGPLVIYDSVGFKSAKSGDEGGMLALAHVDRSIVTSSDWCINFDIKDKKGNEFINKSHIVSLSDPKSYNGKMEKRPFDKSMVINVEGKMGVANVYLCLLKVAVNTFVDAKFKICNKNLNVKVFGTLFGRYGKRFDHGEDDVVKFSRVVLFDKKYDDSILLDKDCNDLLESRVAVAAYSSLILEADFRCVYSDGTEEQIRGCENFSPRGRCSSDKLCLKGDHGEIELRVFFSYPQRRCSPIREYRSSEI